MPAPDDALYEEARRLLEESLRAVRAEIREVVELGASLGLDFERERPELRVIQGGRGWARG